ncbi:hypothetical protein TVAG_291020 [Trichomonas vaginalis G3]|uniref:BEACH domain-containing protein n=1 Tax=Trichomonas vaginalis (strain ATCC PRA-98 / G3) TaxID=412133 RepID=A2F3Y0_TRIV3|nr:BEACH domain-containing protein family [Trichomonas vaginalis G3]EAY00396.1 hypothetical protein TVAG_291020 [Trichomonas vaginalis G3]KAI5528365.1 BEACH domain-containing protein family [Trichomonas vaginalis G3]|eukprot:XP_001313325.1 hypothetical protein [Trichomonas vaginalis G3]
MISSNQLISYFELVQEIKAKDECLVNLEKSFLQNIPNLTQNDKELTNFKYDGTKSIEKFIKDANIVSNCANVIIPTLTNAADQTISIQILLAKIIYLSFSLLDLKDYTNIDDKFCNFMSELEKINCLSTKNSDLIQLAFALVSIYFTSYERFILSLRTLTHFCKYLETMPPFDQGSYTFIAAIFARMPINLNPDFFDEFADSILVLFEKKAPYLMVEKPTTLVDLFTSSFHRFDVRSLNIISSFSLYSQCDNLLAMYASLPSILISEISKYQMSYTKKYQNIPSAYEVKFDPNRIFKIPLNIPEIYTSLSFEKVEDNITLLDVFHPNLQSIMNRLSDALTNSSMSAIMNFIQSYGKIVDLTYQAPNTIYVLAGFVYIMNQIKNLSKTKSIISKLLSSMLFQLNYSVFTCEDSDPVLGLLRNIVINRIVQIDQMLLMQILALGSTNPHMFVEFILRIYKTNVALDYTIFAHANLVSLILDVGTKLSEIKDVTFIDQEKVIYFTFLFNCLANKSFLQVAFSNIDFVRVFLNLGKDFSMLTKIFNVLKTLYIEECDTSALEKYMTNSDFFLSDFDLNYKERVVKLIEDIYVCHPNSQQNLKPLIIKITELLNSQKSQKIMMSLLEIYSHRKEGLSDYETMTLFNCFKTFFRQKVPKDDKSDTPKISEEKPPEKRKREKSPIKKSNSGMVKPPEQTKNNLKRSQSDICYKNCDDSDEIEINKCLQAKVLAKIWEICCGSTAVISLQQAHLFQPSALPLLFFFYRKTDKLIEIFLDQIEFSFFNCYKLHEGFVDYIILKYLSSLKKIKFHNCSLRLEISNIENALKLIETIQKFTSDNSILSLYLDIINENQSENVLKICQSLECSLTSTFSMSKPLFSLGFMDSQFVTKTTEKLFDNGFTASFIVKIAHRSLNSFNLNLSLFMINDSQGNLLRVFLSNNSLMMVIKFNRKKIVANLARSFLSDEWIHIMISVLIDDTNGMTVFPVIDDNLVDAVPIKVKPVFNQNLSIVLGGFDECEVNPAFSDTPIGITHSFSFFNRPLTDEECAVLKNNPLDTKYNPILTSMNFSKSDGFVLHPSTICEVCLENNVTKTLDKFFEQRKDVDENLTLSVFGILHLIYEKMPSEQYYLSPDLISYFFLSHTDPSFQLFNGQLKLFKVLTMTIIKQNWLDKILLNPFIWDRSKDRAMIYKVMTYNMMYFDYNHITPTTVLKFIKLFYQSDYNKEYEHLLTKIAPLANKEHITCWFSQAVFSKDLKLLAILRALINCDKNLLISNQYKKQFMNFCHSQILNDNVYIVEAAIILIHQMSTEPQLMSLDYLNSAFNILVTSPHLNEVFHLLLSDLNSYPNLCNFMCIAALQLGKKAIKQYSVLMYPISCMPSFTKQVILDQNWFVFPLIMSYEADDYDGIINYIIKLLQISNNFLTDVRNMTVFTLYADSLSIPGSKNRMIELLTYLIKSDNYNTDVMNNLVEMLTLLTLYHIGNGISNENIDKTCVETRKTFALMPTSNLLNFVKLDLTNFPLIFQAIVEDDGNWSNSKLGVFILTVVTEKQLKTRKIFNVIDNFIVGKKNTDIKSLVESSHKNMIKIVTAAVKDFTSNLTVSIQFVNTIISNVNRMHYTEMSEHTKFVVYVKERTKKPPTLSFDNTLTLTFLHNKMKLKENKLPPHKQKKKKKPQTLVYSCQLKKIDDSLDSQFSIYQTQFMISNNKNYILEHDNIEYFLLRGEYSFEIITNEGKSFYLQFNSSEFADIMKVIYNCVMKNARIIQRSISSSSFSATKTLSKWINSKLSNFVLLMHLNIYGGRSFRNSTDYPIFPRVFDEKFRILEECPPFENEHRGPLTGDFFERITKHDIVNPEAFSFAEKYEDFPKNFSSSHDFIFQHRLALESEKVSKWLPLWIDQHFGTKSHFNSIIFGSVKSKKPITISPGSLDDEKLSVENVFRIANYKSKVIYILNDGSVVKNNKEIGKMTISDDLIFCPLPLVTYAYSRSQKLIWTIGKEVKSFFFPYKCCCFFILKNDKICFQSSETSLSLLDTNTNEIKMICSLKNRIVKCTGNKVSRSIIVVTDDYLVHSFDAKGKFINSYDVRNEVISILQAGQLGHVIIKTKTDIVVLSCSCFEVRRVPLKHKISRWFIQQNLNQMDVVFFESNEGKIFAFHPVRPDEVTEICSSPGGSIIALDFNRETKIYSLTFDSGIIKHFSYTII